MFATTHKCLAVKAFVALLQASAGHRAGWLFGGRPCVSGVTSGAFHHSKRRFKVHITVTVRHQATPHTTQRSNPCLLYIQ